MRYSVIIGVLVLVLGWVAGAAVAAEDKKPAPVEVRVFHAAGWTQFLELARADAERDLNIRILAEGGGSQAVARKITELGRRCDLVVLADAELFGRLLSGVCPHYTEFATDEIVIGVGSRAPRVAEAETDWVRVLLRPEVKLGRADENLSPMGYRTLMAWQLQARHSGPLDLADRLQRKCLPLVDDVSRLPPLLHNGDLDYAFLYRSTAAGCDLRSIELDAAVNLGDPAADYRGAAVTFIRLKAGAPETVRIAGGPVLWALAVPENALQPEAAARLAEYLAVKRADLLKRCGFRPLSPVRREARGGQGSGFGVQGKPGEGTGAVGNGKTEEWK